MFDLCKAVKICAIHWMQSYKSTIKYICFLNNYLNIVAYSKGFHTLDLYRNT